MNTKLETYVSIVKINAKQLINAMKIAKQMNDVTLLADTIDNVTNNLIAFNIPNNPLMGDIVDCFEWSDNLLKLGDMYDNGTFNDDDFVPNEYINELCIYMQIEYLQSLKNDCLQHFNEWLKNGKLSLHSSNSLLHNVFGDYTITKYIWTDKTMGAN